MSYGRYRSNPAGMREFMNGPTVSNAMYSVAQDMASQANTTGRSSYQAYRRTVTGGHRATERAGAEVVEVERDRQDVADRVLVNLSRNYRMRGGSG